MTRTVSALLTAILAAFVHLIDRHYDAQTQAIEAASSAESYRALIEVAVGRQPARPEPGECPTHE